MDERVVLSTEVDPTHYVLHIDTNLDKPNESEELLFGATVDISLTVKVNGLKKITLHSKELDFTKCTYLADGADEEIQTTAINLNEEAKTVDFIFGPEIPQGAGTLHVEYTGKHNKQMAGFYRSDYTAQDGSKKIMISTQFEPLDARRCFPCVDEPGRKATFQCTLVVNEDLVALSNMPVMEEKSVGNGRKQVKFETTPMMSTYLLAFVVGEFDYIEGKTENGVVLRVYTPPGKQDHGNFALEIGLKALDLFDETFGEKFPLPKMDMVGIPEFAAGAMENWGLITYREAALLLDPDNASAQQTSRVCNVVVHELAHQWFGNLVTMEWWSDLWLNEGFASYMQTYIINKIFPEWEMNEQFIVNTQNPALLLDAMQSSHPIQVPIKHAEEVEEVFDLISYQKGASVVRLVYATLGEESFLKGLQDYMDQHKYNNTMTKDLWAAWEDASGLPVAEIMSSWTEQMGFPLVTVVEEEWKPEEGKCILTLEQRRFLADGSVPTGSDDTTWKFPLFVSTKHGTRKLEELFEERRQTFEIDIKADDKWVKLNGGQDVPLRVNYTSSMWERLIEGLETAEVENNCDQTGLLLDARALTQAQMMDPAILLRLLSTFKKEESYPVWFAIQSCLGALSRALVEEQDLSGKLATFAASLVRDKAEAIGWDSDENDGVTVRLLRSLLVNLQCGYDGSNEAIREEAIKRFKQYVKDPTAPGVSKSMPADLKVAIFRVALSNPANEKSYEELREAHEKVGSNVERRDIYFAIGSTYSKDNKVDVLDWATSGQVPIQDFAFLFDSVAGDGIQGRQLAFDYFRENFDSIRAKVSSGSPFIFSRVVKACCGGFASEEKASEIEEFFEERDSPDIKRTVAQVVEATRTKAKFASSLTSSEAFRQYLENAAPKEAPTQATPPPVTKEPTKQPKAAPVPVKRTKPMIPRSSVEGTKPTLPRTSAVGRTTSRWQLVGHRWKKVG